MLNRIIRGTQSTESNAEPESEMAAIIPPGTRVALTVAPESTDDTLLLETQLNEWLQGNEFLIEMPIHKERHYRLPPEPLPIKFFSSPDVLVGLGQFVETTAKSGLLLTKMMMVGELQPHQVRAHYRQSCSFDVAIERSWCREALQDSGDSSVNMRDIEALLSRTRALTKTSDKAIEGESVNISVGGMLFATTAELEAGDKINLSFDLAPGEQESVDALVLRVGPPCEKTQTRNVAVQFKHMNQRQTDQIFRYITKLQSRKTPK